MRRRLSIRAFAVAGSGGLLFIAGATAQAGWLFVLASGVLGLVAGSLFVRQYLNAATVTRSVPGRTRIGDEVRVGLTVSNRSRKRLPIMRITDHFSAFERTAVASERIDPGGEAHIEDVRRALRRGEFESGPVVLRSGAPFGFMSTSRTIEVASPLVVTPTWVELTSFPILEPSSFPSDVLHERARTGAGEEYLGVREYRPGDPRRSVHWRSTARAGRLVVREFEEEVASKVALVLGGGDQGSPPDSAFESLVSAAASIAIYALQTGHPVDLTRYSANGELERAVEPDRFAVLDWLARATPYDAELGPLVREALGRIGRRGTAVILAPTAGRAGEDVETAIRSVQAAGSRAIAVLARSSTWLDTASPGSTETDPVLERLRQGRAPVRAVAKGDDLLRCLSA